MPSRETFAYRRGAQLKALRAAEKTVSPADSIYAKAAEDFHVFCTLLDKPPARHMLEWHRELITGESNKYLLNIADGEGWGLVSFEHGSCRKPQVVPNHTACADIWKGSGLLADIATWVTDKDLGVQRGLVDTNSVADLLTDLYADSDLYEKVADACYEVTQRPEYRWESVAAGFSQAIKEMSN